MVAFVTELSDPASGGPRLARSTIARKLSTVRMFLEILRARGSAAIRSLGGREFS